MCECPKDGYTGLPLAENVWVRAKCVSFLKYKPNSEKYVEVYLIKIKTGNGDSNYLRPLSH